MPGITELAREVERCGWRGIAVPSLREAVQFRSFQGLLLAHARCYRNAGDRALLWLALPEAEIAGEEDLFARFLDLAMETRMALTLSRRIAADLAAQLGSEAPEIEWLLLQTGERVELFRPRDEACELRNITADRLEQDLLPALAARARGRLGRSGDGLHQLPEAESLAGWLRHWSSQLAALLGESQETGYRLLWKWLLMLQVGRRLSDGDTAAAREDEGWGLKCRLAEGRWEIGYEAFSATEDLCRELHRFDQTFSTWLLSDDTEKLVARLQGLDETSIIDRLRAEMLMHSQNRFEPETVAWLFTDLAREQRGWRRDVRGSEPIQRRLEHDGWQVFSPVVCDVERYGLTAALGDCERLARYLQSIDMWLDQRNAAQSGDQWTQPDLFLQQPRGVGPSGRLDDGLNFLLGEALRLRGVKAEDRLGVGITFLLKMLQLAPMLSWPFLGIDTLDRILKER